MTVFAAFGVPKKSASIHIGDVKGTCLWRGKILTDPDALAVALSPFGDDLAVVGLETGCWTTCLWHALFDRWFSMVCMDARQAHATVSISVNKTDANDAQGLAHLLRTGLFCEVRVKSWEYLLKRALLRARATMLRCVLDFATAIRGARCARSASRLQREPETAWRRLSSAEWSNILCHAPTLGRSSAPCWRRGVREECS